jgi:hypothetical protein
VATSAIHLPTLYRKNYLPRIRQNGRTPSELAGITVEGENKWLTLIQNSAKRPTKIDSRKNHLETGGPTAT